MTRFLSWYDTEKVIIADEDNSEVAHFAPSAVSVAHHCPLYVTSRYPIIQQEKNFLT